MSSDKEDDGFLSNIIKGYEDGYNKQDKAIEQEKEQETSTNRHIEGVAVGLAEGMLNPVRWLSSIFR